MENTPPPPPPQDENQTLQQSTVYNASDESIYISRNRFIVVLKGQKERGIDEHTVKETVVQTEKIFSDYNIPKNSLIHQYKYATSGFAVHMSEERAEILRSDPRIKYVVNDIAYRAIQENHPNDVSKLTEESLSSPIPWGVARVGGPLNGAGSRAWVLDTGVQLDHPDLNVDVGNSVSFIADETATDYHGHGTQVAGVIAAENNSNDIIGVSAGAYVVSVKVCSQAGRCYVSDVTSGVDYVAGNYSSGEVANISLSYPVDDPSHPSIDEPLSILEDAIISAADSGLMFTLPAGNQSTDVENRSPARIISNNVFTISAMDQNDVFAAFSNFGNPQIDFSNPGVDIHTTTINNSTAEVSGTSFAAPHFAGLLLSNPDDIRVDGYVTSDPSGNPDPIAAYVPFEVTISGPNALKTGEMGLWTASVDNPDGTVSYQWYYTDSSTSGWVSAGTNSNTYSRMFAQPSQFATQKGVRVVVTDESGEAEDTQYITVLQDEDCSDPTLPCRNEAYKDTVLTEPLPVSEE